MPVSSHPLYVTIRWLPPLLYRCFIYHTFLSRSYVYPIQPHTRVFLRRLSNLSCPWLFFLSPNLFMTVTFKLLGYRPVPTAVLPHASAHTLRPLLTLITSSAIGFGDSFPSPASNAVFHTAVAPSLDSELLCSGTSCCLLQTAWTTVHVLPHVAATDCTSCSSCSFLHRPFRLFHPQHLVFSTLGSSFSRTTHIILFQNPSPADVPVVAYKHPVFPLFTHPFDGRLPLTVSHTHEHVSSEVIYPSHMLLLISCRTLVLPQLSSCSQSHVSQLQTPSPSRV